MKKRLRNIRLYFTLSMILLSILLIWFFYIKSSGEIENTSIIVSFVLLIISVVINTISRKIEEKKSNRKIVYPTLYKRASKEKELNKKSMYRILYNIASIMGSIMLYLSEILVLILLFFNFKMDIMTVRLLAVIIFTVLALGLFFESLKTIFLSEEYLKENGCYEEIDKNNNVGWLNKWK